MSEGIPAIVVALKTATLILGATVTYLAFKAYWRTQSNGLRWLAVGFGIVTFGALLGGIVDQLLALDSNTALVVESAMTTVGLAVIVYSLYETQ